MAYKLRMKKPAGNPGKKGNPKKLWIKGAVKMPGALRATAKRAGALDKKGRIKLSWLQSKKGAPGKLGRRVRLALTLRKMRK